MNTLESIANRRSIRKFTQEPVAREAIERILNAAIQAPSAKNRQPWRYVVVKEAHDGMIEAMEKGLALRAQTVAGELERQMLQGSLYTLAIMKQAPVTVFVLNAEGKTPFEGLAPLGERFMELANVQSIGAAVENMCLAATDLGLGSLWICDVFDAYDTLTQWLDTEDQLVCAVSFGHPAESPAARPRKPFAEVVSWR